MWIPLLFFWILLVINEYQSLSSGVCMYYTEAISLFWCELCREIYHPLHDGLHKRNLIPSNRVLWVLLVDYYPPLVTEVTVACEFIVLLCVLWVFPAYLSPSSCHWRYCNWSYHILLDVMGTEYGSLALLLVLLDVGWGRISSITHRFENLVTRKWQCVEKIRRCGLIGGRVLFGVGSEFTKRLIKVQCFPFPAVSGFRCKILSSFSRTWYSDLPPYFLPL